MRITPKEDIKFGQAVLEAGATISTEKHGISDSDAMKFYEYGLVEIEGKDPAPARRVTGSASIDPQPSSIGATSTEA
jgi:hypothetical protein